MWHLGAQTQKHGKHCGSRLGLQGLGGRPLPSLTSLTGANKCAVTKLEEFHVPCNLNSRSSRSLTVFCRVENSD